MFRTTAATPKLNHTNVTVRHAGMRTNERWRASRRSTAPLAFAARPCWPSPTRA